MVIFEQRIRAFFNDPSRPMYASRSWFQIVHAGHGYDAHGRGGRTIAYHVLGFGFSTFVPDVHIARAEAERLVAFE